MNIAKIAIVLLNYRSWQDTIECLESVLKLDSDFETQIFVVDNSCDGDLCWNNLLKWAEGKILVNQSSLDELVFPVEKKPIPYQVVDSTGKDIIEDSAKIVFSKSNENKGFSAGNNIALNYILNFSNIDYKYTWLLNNDTVVPKDALSRLTDYYQQADNSLGILGSAMLYYNDPNVLQGIGGKYNKWFGSSKPIMNAVDYEKIKGNEKIDYPIGAAMLVTKSFLEDVGLMNEEYFLYYEELDWVIRGNHKGYSVDYCKESKVYHKVGGSIGTGKALERSEFSDYYTLKNRLKFTKKYYSGYLPFTYIGYLLVIANRIRRKQYSYAINAIKIMLNLPVSKFAR